LAGYSNAIASETGTIGVMPLASIAYLFSSSDNFFSPSANSSANYFSALSTCCSKNKL
jgi:hypothetical protein